MFVFSKSNECQVSRHEKCEIVDNTDPELMEWSCSCNCHEGAG